MAAETKTEPFSPVSEPGPPEEASCFPTPRQLFVLLACYFALQVVLRLVSSTSVDLDEAEQVMLSQKLSLGYGSDPPLYTWLQIGFFSVCGESVLGLSLLKNLLLFGIYLLIYACARRITARPLVGVAAALSVFYLPGTAWEAQRDLTHSTLAAILSCATLLCFLRLHETRRVSRYLLFGLGAGLGLMTKYNYVFWLLGLALAAGSLAHWRAAVLDWRMLLAAAVCMLVFLPNGLWVLTHRDLAFLKVSKFDIRASLGWLPTVALGLKHIVQSLVSFAAPLAAVYCVVFFRAPVRAATSAGAAGRALLLRTWILIGGILVLLVLVARVTGFKERWFQPLLIALPVLAVTLVDRRLDVRRLKVMATLSFVIMAAVALVMPGRLLIAERAKREEPLTRPYAALAAQARASIPPQSLVVCDTRLLAGNLRLKLSDIRAVTPELMRLFRGEHPHAFLSWDATRNAEVPRELQAAAVALGAKQVLDLRPQFFAATYRYHKTKEYKIGLLQIE